MTSYVNLEDHQFKALLMQCTTKDEVRGIREALEQEEVAVSNNFKNTLNPQAQDVQARLDENTNDIAQLQKYRNLAFERWMELIQT